MSSSDKSPPCMDGPVVFEAKIFITNGKDQTGSVTYAFSPGTFPTQDMIDKAIASSALAARDQGDYRLMDRDEFICDQLGLGTRFAVPGPDKFPNASKWDVTQTTEETSEDR